MNILITWGAGFIGSNFIRYFIKKYPNYYITNFDKLTYAGNLKNLEWIDKKNYTFIKGDVCNLDFLISVLKDIDVVIHFAAESHVDVSIGNSLIFTKSNTYGTHVLLEACRVCKVKKIIHFSTDEVYWDILEGSFKEDSKLTPNNPYSASKAGAEMVVNSYKKTYNMPIITIRWNNNYGPYQYPEKIISKFAVLLIEDKKVPLHSPKPVRTYLHVKDTASAIDTIFHKGELGETYNVWTSDEYSNLEITYKLLKYFGKSKDYIEHINDRPFNDIRYSIDISKITNLGRQQKVPFEKGLEDTLKWYQDNKEWWKN